MQLNSFNDIDVNLSATEKLKKQTKYQRLLMWLHDNGALIDQRVNYPMAFGQNAYVGVGCSERIQAYRAIIAIPRKLIIDVGRVRKIPEFETIIKQNPRMFNCRQQTDAAFNTLSLFLIHQQLKGQDSFFYPYFQASECKNLLLHWTKAQLQQLQNRQIIEHVQAYKDDLQFQFMNFLRIIRRYQKIFPTNINNQTYKKMFEWASEFVMTRAFGWSVPTASLIPFADMLNHGEPYLDHFLVDIQREKYPENQQEGYIAKKKRCNMNIFKKQHLVPTPEQFKTFRQIKPTSRRKYINKHLKLITGDPLKVQQKKSISNITHQQYNSGIHTIRQLYFGQSSCSQDNDTEDDQIADFAYRTQKLKIDDKAILKGKSKVPLKNGLQKYWQLFKETKLKNKKVAKKEIEEQPKEQVVSSEEEQEEQQFQSSLNSKKSQQLQISQSQDDLQFDWINTSKQQDVYFVLFTNRPYNKGQQLYNFYGRRSNRFLLLGYNFATISNKYDSYTFRMIVDPLSCIKPVPARLVFSKLLNIKQNHNMTITRQLRIKKQRICIQLINHCRCIYLAYHHKDNLSGYIPITIPTDRLMQQKVLKLARQIIRYQLDQYRSDMEEDEEIIKNSMTPPRLYTAVVIRLLHKRILMEHLKLIDKCGEYLGRWKKGKINLQQKQMAEVCKVKQYLYQLQRSQL